MANIHTPIPKLKLNDGTSIPMLGYGTGTAWFKQTEESQIDQACIDGVKTAIDLGYTYLDGAQCYKTETELGTAIKQSGKKRQDFYLVTKIMIEEEPGDLATSLKTSLKKLQVEYVDLYLIHTPFYSQNKADHQSRWHEMEELQKAGLTRSIGVSNYQIQQLEWILETANVVPALNQIEFHAYLQQDNLLKFHKEKGIATAAYGPLSAILRADSGPIDDFLAALAKKYAVSTGEICLRWCIDQDVVAVTTSSKEQRLSDYLRAMTFKLTPAEIKQINELGAQRHYRNFFKSKFPDEASQ